MQGRERGRGRWASCQGRERGRVEGISTDVDSLSLNPDRVRMPQDFPALSSEWSLATPAGTRGPRALLWLGLARDRIHGPHRLENVPRLLASSGCYLVPVGESHRDTRSEAESIYAETLGERREVDIEALCREHPRLSPDLRQLHAEYHRRGRRVIGERAGSQALAERLRFHYGPDVDPHLLLEREGAADVDLSSDLTDRLTGRHDFGRYRVTGEVARGGQGAVFSVWDEDLRRNLAMKVRLTADESGMGRTPTLDSRTLRRFLEEAQLTAQLDHPGIVPVHELGLDAEARIYFTMKLVKGQDLKTVFDLLHEGKEGWSRTRALGVMLKVCEAMAYAHHKGVIHRDLKPANVMVGRFGAVYVMDWGLARVVDREDLRKIRPRSADSSTEITSDRWKRAEGSADLTLMTEEGDVLGTPAYMPPEQARGELEAMGPHSDVYAVGAMLYHLLTGQMPHVPPGARVSNRDTWRAVRKGPPQPLAKLAPDVTPELVAICEKAMARDTSARYQNMFELAEDLRAFLEHRVVSAYRTGAVAELRKWVERNKPLAGALAAAFLALVTGFVVALVLKNQSDRNALLATERGDVSEARRRDVLRLSALQNVEDLLAEVDELWPALPHNIERLRSWIERSHDLVAELPAHREQLASMDQLLEGERATSQTSVEARWWSSQLSKLIGELEALERDLLAEGAVAPGHGWTLTSRLAFAQRIEAGFAPGGEYARAWSAALPSIRETYPGLDLRPRPGLVPLARNPDSGLWEFWVVLSGSRPEARDPATGSRPLRPETGIVLVLLPGGAFPMGSPESDPRREPNEELHEVTLGPFFLSKYEVTQAQWERVMGSNPSGLVGENPLGTAEDADLEITPLHPVESVSWVECVRFADRLALQLPTEEQWEYACRAGTETPFFWGSEDSTLEWTENVRDLSHGAAQGLLPTTALWEDGFRYHAPVGSFAPNGFGLYDMHGNVAEWCQDLRREYLQKRESRDEQRRVFRGGSWYFPPVYCRSAYRQFDLPEVGNMARGLRVARSLGS